MGGVAKYFRFSWDEILWGLSWANLMMLLATIPKYKKPETSQEDDVSFLFD